MKFSNDTFEKGAKHEFIDECEVGLTLIYRGNNNVIKRYLLSAGVFKTGLYSITLHSSTVGLRVG